MRTSYASTIIYFFLLLSITVSIMLEKNPLAKATLMAFLVFLVLPVMYGFYRWYTGKPSDANRVDVAAYFEVHDRPHIHYRLDIVFRGLGKDEEHELELMYCPLTRQVMQVNPIPIPINCMSYSKDFDEKSNYYGE